MAKIAKPIIKKTKEECWVLFPFVGLKLKDSINNFIKPLYGDATIVTKEEVIEAAQTDNWTNDNINALQARLKDSMYKRYHSFIGVKRSIDPDNKEISQTYNVYKQALERAEEISAAIGLSYLVNSSQVSTKRLMEQNNCRQKSILIVQNQSNKLVHIESGIDYVAPKPTTLETLNKITLQPAFKNVNDLLLNINLEQKQSKKSFQITIKKVAKLICKVINIEGDTNPSATLLGCFTAIELLLDEQGDNSDLKNRLNVLNNCESDDYFEISEIFNMRNNYVHRSQEVIPKYSRLSIALALNTLYKVSNISDKYTSKLDVIKYLDFIHKGMQLDDTTELRRYITGHAMQFKGKYKFKFIEEMKKKDN